MRIKANLCTGGRAPFVERTGRPRTSIACGHYENAPSDVARAISGLEQLRLQRGTGTRREQRDDVPPRRSRLPTGRKVKPDLIHGSGRVAGTTHGGRRRRLAWDAMSCGWTGAWDGLRSDSGGWSTEQVCADRHRRPDDQPRAARAERERSTRTRVTALADDADGLSDQGARHLNRSPSSLRRPSRKRIQHSNSRG